MNENYYRCIHCGGYTGTTIQETKESAGWHGMGICVSSCHWCNDRVRHAPHACTNGMGYDWPNDTRKDDPRYR